MRKFFFFLLCGVSFTASAQQIFQMPKNADSRVSSFENPNGVKGNGGKTNKTAKGMHLKHSKKARQNIAGCKWAGDRSKDLAYCQPVADDVAQSSVKNVLGWRNKTRR
jgi:hypothetical protein